MAEKSICISCFHSYVCEEFNEHRDSNNKKCHFFYDHFVPIADVVEVKHGEWEFIGDKYANCTNCGTIFEALPTAYAFKANNLYCRHCGAKMDGKE